MGAIARRTLHGRGSSGRVKHRLLEAETPEAVSGRLGGSAEEVEVNVRGVIRSGDVPILTRYGTAYGVYDYPSAGYDCVLKSDAYRLGEYVGDYVEITGALVDVGKELPVMNVTRLELLRTKWMR